MPRQTKGIFEMHDGVKPEHNSTLSIRNKSSGKYFGKRYIYDDYWLNNNQIDTLLENNHHIVQFLLDTPGCMWRSSDRDKIKLLQQQYTRYQGFLKHIKAKNQQYLSELKQQINDVEQTDNTTNSTEANSETQLLINDKTESKENCQLTKDRILIFEKNCQLTKEEADYLYQLSRVDLDELPTKIPEDFVEAEKLIAEKEVKELDDKDSPWSKKTDEYIELVDKFRGNKDKVKLIEEGKSLKKINKNKTAPFVGLTAAGAITGYALFFVYISPLIIANVTFPLFTFLSWFFAFLATGAACALPFIGTGIGLDIYLDSKVAAKNQEINKIWTDAAQEYQKKQEEQEKQQTPDINLNTISVNTIPSAKTATFNDANHASNHASLQQSSTTSKIIETKK